jgi:nitrogen fixation protein FixH
MATGTVGKTRITVSAPGGGFVHGHNLVRVEVRDTTDQPIDVSGVAITLRAPAVGALDAQTRDVSLARQGIGVYEGRTVLTRNGPWMGTVLWQENGAEQTWSFSTSTP